MADVYEFDTLLLGAFHHSNSSNPRYKLNTSNGRYETIDESVSPNEWLELTENGEPEWTLKFNEPTIVILTCDLDSNRVTAIREASS